MMKCLDRILGLISAGLLTLFVLATVRAADDLPKTLQIAYQKDGILPILKARGDLDRRLNQEGVAVEWLQFQFGPPILEALNVGSVQLGETGEAPPIFAQAAEIPFVYLGNEPANPNGEALLLPKGSTITKLSDLKGKRIAVPQGSNAHYFLVKALESAGLKYTDVQVAYLTPADGRAAFDGGSVDAWAVWEPYVQIAVQTDDARVLVDGTNLVKNWDFILARRELVEKYPRLAAILKEEVVKANQWAAQDPHAVAELLAPALKIDVDILETVARKKNRGFSDLSEEVIAYQQNIADTFLKLGLIDKPITVRDAVPATPVSAPAPH